MYQPCTGIYTKETVEVGGKPESMEAREESISRRNKLNKIRAEHGPWSIRDVLVDGRERQMRREWVMRKER